MEPTAHAELSVLGRISCRSGGRPLLLAPRGERLLAYLALQRTPVRRDQVYGALWGDSSDARAASNLRSTLWRLPRTEAGPLVEVAEGHVGLCPGITVDLWRLEGEDVEECEQVLLAGDLLPGWDDDWVSVERERYRQLRLHALEELCAARRSAARFADALRLGLVAVQTEPLRETAHRQVIEVHLAEGNAGEALRQYDAFRRLLHAELGLPPSPAMRRLVDTVLDASAAV
ncbi:AfsR/SARP family transcriptional regulator [Actinomycetospora lemnae]|uniref:BTAD domain-containing putative transcriptional regulator n=1 Tax=Actinomycetospora lemnae TaxID=3019891 RepID=A0ABT5SR53_9PSEU|nr:BTAD domain-containing putative transcriptional regulator [Actinomycetospora sp. DW7H6]MDD7965274.1 BTAD domain-containing putative transcriptional regulator [Actinomycetospora sp. DW7H6]